MSLPGGKLNAFSLALGFTILLFGAPAPFASGPIRRSKPDIPALNYDVHILRDTWGVPHIFGVTDPDVAYGLAYAHSEDDFDTIQKAILAARGELASHLGKKYVASDYFVALLRVRDQVRDSYDHALAPDVRALCEAYAAGLNRYARRHPKEVRSSILPFTGQDIVAGFVHKLPLFMGVDKELRMLLQDPGLQVKHDLEIKEEFEYGSNAFAVSPNRSANGETFLAINSHQPWQGPVSWYEAHIRSEEGWDMAGGVFPGTPVILQGHNRRLGWALTVNKPDLVDTFILEINPKNSRQYKLDGSWRDLDIRTVPLAVKLFGPIKWAVTREVLWSEFGPVVRGPDATYAIRYAGIGEVRHLEQWYRMNKAQTFSAWRTAMQMTAIPMFNAVYADAAQNIYYVFNGKLPLRDERFDWRKPVPGNTTATLWKEYVPFDGLPQVLNPKAGFVQNCNSTPFRATLGEDNPDAVHYPKSLGIRNRMTNRSWRAFELFGADTAITLEEFRSYKYDMSYSRRSAMAELVVRTLNARQPRSPVGQDALRLLRSWNLSTDPENRAAALAILTLQPFLRQKQYDAEPAALLRSLVKTAEALQSEFGRIDVQWQVVNRLVRGETDLGLGGGPDVLHTVYGKKAQATRLEGHLGDSHVMFVSWDRDGVVRSSSIHPFGAATGRPASRHYADQADLFAQRKVKPLWLDLRDIRAHLEREYRP